MIPRFIAAFIFVAYLVSRVAAQDPRTVVEPFFPPLCATVDAELQSSGGTLLPADEHRLDTARIQHAIDRCGKGRAVKLRVDENKNAFLVGPLELRPDVTLILDRGVTLLASLDPSLYARSPGSCGETNDASEGCKPLISADRASGSGIMGDGVIDGRGGEKILGSQYSWWELAAQARAGQRQQAPRLIGADGSNRFTLYRVTLRNAPGEAAMFDHGDGFTVWGVRVETVRPGASSAEAIATGSGAKNVAITRSYLGAGDDSALH